MISDVLGSMRFINFVVVSMHSSRCAKLEETIRVYGLYLVMSCFSSHPHVLLVLQIFYQLLKI